MYETLPEPSRRECMPSIAEGWHDVAKTQNYSAETRARAVRLVQRPSQAGQQWDGRGCPPASSLVDVAREAVIGVPGRAGEGRRLNFLVKASPLLGLPTDAESLWRLLHKVMQQHL